MTYVNDKGYLERKTRSGRRNEHGRPTKRDWWIVKAGGGRGDLPLNNISFPSKMIGKKVMFKVEMIDEK